jgi:transcriptional regulator with XRE-family HTH domain
VADKDNKSFDNTELGKRINIARKAKKISSEKLSEYIGKSSGSSIRSVERGATGISVEALVEICNVLEVSPEYLLDAYLKENTKAMSKSPLGNIADELSIKAQDLLLQFALLLKEQDI